MAEGAHQAYGTIYAAWRAKTLFFLYVMQVFYTLRISCQGNVSQAECDINRKLRVNAIYYGRQR